MQDGGERGVGWVKVLQGREEGGQRGCKHNATRTRTRARAHGAYLLLPQRLGEAGDGLLLLDLLLQPLRLKVFLPQLLLQPRQRRLVLLLLRLQLPQL